jgi:transcriptional regulator with XRE-family HTH domain
MVTATQINPKRVLQARLRAKFTQDDLAFKIRELSGGSSRTSTKQISRWENGQAGPHSSIVPLIARACDVAIDYLYAADDDEEPRSVVLLRAAEHHHALGQLMVADVLRAAADREEYRI